MKTRCLWVDDAPDVARKKARQLEQAFRCTFDFAADFPTALRKLQASDYDVLITDNIFGSRRGGVEKLVGRRLADNCAGEAFIAALISGDLPCHSSTLKKIVLYTGVEVPPFALIKQDPRVKHAHKAGLSIASLIEQLEEVLVPQGPATDAA